MNIVPPVKKAETKLTLTEVKQQKLLAKLEAESIRREKERLALKNKQNTADKLKLAIAKANLALGKGGNIFDMDAIQLNAAMINQAEQLGKATNAAQVLAITNDIARLRVKQDILELEKAIASGDEAAITAATKKLNEDLKILGTLQQQSVKLLDIKSILETLLPKDLINLQNLKDAIALLAQIAASNLAKPAGTPSFTPTTGTVAAAIAARAGTDVSGVNDPRVAYGGQRVDSAGNYVSYNPDMAAAFSAAAGRAGASNTTVNVTVNAGVGDPNAIAEAINQVLQDAVDRGTLRGGSY